MEIYLAEIILTITYLIIEGYILYRFKFDKSFLLYFFKDSLILFIGILIYLLNAVYKLMKTNKINSSQIHSYLPSNFEVDLNNQNSISKRLEEDYENALESFFQIFISGWIIVKNITIFFLSVLMLIINILEGTFHFFVSLFEFVIDYFDKKYFSEKVLLNRPDITLKDIYEKLGGIENKIDNSAEGSKERWWIARIVQMALNVFL